MGSKGDWLFAVHDLCSILPASGAVDFGVYNETSIVLSYNSRTATFSAGPSLAIYSMTTCGRALCGRVVGIAPGGHAQTDVYLAGPLGISVSANVDWVGGSSLVLPGGVAVMVVAGPTLRWSSK